MADRLKSSEAGRPATTQIRAQLERLLESPPFRTSRRCSDFLRHVVEESCEGRHDQLKERTLGVTVFEREADYDTNQDPVVRNTAGQVRKRLAQYYCEPGRDREVRIDLPPGSYVPEIYLPESPTVTPPPAPMELRASSGKRLPLIGVIAALVLATGLLAVFWSQWRSRSTLELFWAPLVEHSGPVVLVVGQGHAYKLAGDLDKLFDEPSGLSSEQLGRTIPLRDIIPAFERYVGLTDVQALIRLSGLFSKFNKPIELRGGRTTSLADLRGKLVVLVGAFNNSWTLSLTGEQRFYFELDAPNNLEIVRDRLRPENRSWRVSREASVAQLRTDYAIVSRVFNPTTEKAIVVAAGIRGGGTAAAGEFLTNPAYLAQALKNAPRGWADKNVQFVLATPMFAGTPGPPSVVAAHYW
jgi:hypothetical protein